MRDAIQSIDRWQRLRALGNSRLVKSSYIWLFAVPIAARMFEAVPDPIVVVINEYNIPIPTSLPFRWQMFYFMSFFFAVGQFLYALYCPRIVKEFATYGEYSGAHSGYSEISDMLQEIVDQCKKSVVERAACLETPRKAFTEAEKTFRQILNLAKSSNVKNARPHVATFTNEQFAGTEFSTPEVKGVSGSLAGETTAFLGFFSNDKMFMNDLFDLLRNYQGSKPSLARRCSVISFIIGFIFFATLVIKSFYVVLLQAFQ